MKPKAPMDPDSHFEEQRISDQEDLPLFDGDRLTREQEDAVLDMIYQTALVRQNFTAERIEHIAGTCGLHPRKQMASLMQRAQANAYIGSTRRYVMSTHSPKRRLMVWRSQIYRGAR